MSHSPPGPPSRVHITEATLSHLDKAYEVEDGHGQQRDSYLKEMNIRTYLVIDPRVRGLRRGGGRGGTGRAHTPGKARAGRAGRGAGPPRPDLDPWRRPAWRMSPPPHKDPGVVVGGAGLLLACPAPT